MKLISGFDLIVTISFVGLTCATLLSQDHRQKLKLRGFHEWIIDGLGLIIQGWVIPLVGAQLIVLCLNSYAPTLYGMFDCGWLGGFLINFVLVDYLYYWNHRVLHTHFLWPTHALHHSSHVLDVFSTARNTLWTPLCIVYVWAHGLALFFLADPSGYLCAAAISAALDLWRHSQFNFSFNRSLFKWITSPQNHAAHHAIESQHGNFGANFNLWDRIHCTYIETHQSIPRFGLDHPVRLLKSFFIPVRP